MRFPNGGVSGTLLFSASSLLDTRRRPAIETTHIKDIAALLKETGAEWWNHKAPRLGAALSYYTIFSLAPMLLLVVAVAGFFLGDDAVEGHIVDEMQELLGHDGAAVLQAMLVASSSRTSGALATAIGLGVMLIGATSVMIELQDSLNTVWRAVPKPGLGLKGVLRDRLLSLGLVLSFGFVLLVSLGMSAALAAAGVWVRGIIPAWVIVGRLLSELISFGTIALFLALIFKFLPAASISWSDVSIGALLTSALFLGGKFLIGLYIGKASIGSTFGATGSLAVLLVWVYYSSMIMLLGAEFTRAYAARYGSGVIPNSTAVRARDAD